MPYPGETLPSFVLAPLSYNTSSCGVLEQRCWRQVTFSGIGHLVLTSHTHDLHHGFSSTSRLLSQGQCAGSQRKIECWYSPNVLKIENWQNKLFSMYWNTKLCFILLRACALSCVHTTLKILSSKGELCICNQASLGWTLHIHTYKMLHWYIPESVLPLINQAFKKML